MRLDSLHRGCRATRSSNVRRGGLRTLAACCLLGAVPGTTQGVVTTVYVFDFDFSANKPDEGPITDPTISLGDTVRWVWIDDMHTSTSALGQPETWQSGMFDTGDTFEHTFTNVGIFWYYCEPHGVDNGDGTASGMAGTITVVPAAGTLAMAGLAGALGLRRRRAR